MQIYNTLSGKKEKLETVNQHEINIYVCGPTTYNYIHLGNARPVVVFDTFRRYLSYRGYKVNYVQNFTDIDDKIINRAIEEGEDPIKLAQRYIEEYFNDVKKLGIVKADVHPRVSQHIEDIIVVVKALIEKGFAYEVDGDVYYRVKAFADYGKLSGRALEDMLSGARIEIDERKEEAVDFALWKKSKEGEPAWESPWGQGRPGWHIECSVMSMKYLGETLDIHGGGSDLIFPHHENEIAQSEAYTGKPFANYWMHNGFITIKNEKMSKSLGNFFLLRDILAKYPGDVVRYYLIATHYRSPLDFDDGKLEEAKKALGRLKTTLNLLQEFIDEKNRTLDELYGRAKEFINDLEEKKEHFIDAMDDDFNTARAIGVLFDIAHTINSFVAHSDISDQQAQTAASKAEKTYKGLGDILGIFMEKDEEKGVEIQRVLDVYLQLRQFARNEKNFILADQLRDKLTAMEITIEDNSSGSKARYENKADINMLMQDLIDLRKEYKKKKDYEKADFIRNSLQSKGIILEDTREGARWKFVDA